MRCPARAGIAVGLVSENENRLIETAGGFADGAIFHIRSGIYIGYGR
jgi:hypothetical protein